MITRRNALASCAATGAAAVIAHVAWAESEGASGAKAEASAGGVRMAQTARIPTSAANPYVIANPSPGFVNLSGSAANELVAGDRAALADVFQNNVQIADNKLPRCNVLFLYCTLEPSTRVAGYKFSFRDLIKGAGAHVAVLASDHVDLLSNPGWEGARLKAIGGEYRHHAEPNGDH